MVSEMETPSIHATLKESSHRGRILMFESRFSVSNFFQIFRYLNGFFDFEQSEPIAQWYCKCKSFLFCQYTDSLLHTMLIGCGINGLKFKTNEHDIVVFANLAAQTATYILANEALFAQLALPAPSDPTLDPSLAPAPADAPSVAAAADAAATVRPIDQNARRVLLDSWIGIPSADDCRTVSRKEFKEIHDTTSGTRRKRSKNHISSTAKQTYLSQGPPPLRSRRS